MARKSARILGGNLGLNAKETNKVLESIGLLKRSKYVSRSGSPLWDLTEKGKKFGGQSKHPYSSGHVWDDAVKDLVRNFLHKK